MSEPTDQDMRIASDLAYNVVHAAAADREGDRQPDEPTVNGSVYAIAAALAAEREKARAPFLALADELEEFALARRHAATGTYDDGLRRAQANAASHIRKAAEQ